MQKRRFLDRNGRSSSSGSRSGSGSGSRRTYGSDSSSSSTSSRRGSDDGVKTIEELWDELMNMQHDWSNSDTTRRDGRNYRNDEKSGNSNDARQTLQDIFFGSSGTGSSIEELLQALGLGGKLPKGLGDMDDDQRLDWIKELYEKLYSQRLTEENRVYNEGLLQDQRLYDSPTNQLARLMGAGMSRDAALKILGSGGFGSGSSIPYSDPPQMVEGLSPSESELNSVQAKTAIANSVFNGIGSLVGLTNLGLSIPQAMSQISILKNSAYLSNKQKSAYDSAASAFGIIASAGSLSGDVFGSIESISSTIQNLASKGNSAASAFVSNGGLQQLQQTAPYSLPFLNQMYRNERDSSDYATSFGATMRKMFAETELLNTNKDMLTVQMDKVQDEVANLRASTDYTLALAALENFHAELINEQTKAQRLSNELESSWRSPEGMSLYRDKVLQGLYKEVATLSQMNNAKIWEKEVKTMLSNQDYLQATYELGELYAEGTFDALNDTESNFQDMLYLCRAADDCGLFDYVQSQIDAHTSGSVVGMFGTQIKSGVLDAEGTLSGLKIQSLSSKKNRKGRKIH